MSQVILDELQNNVLGKVTNREGLQENFLKPGSLPLVRIGIPLHKIVIRVQLYGQQVRNIKVFITQVIDEDPVVCTHASILSIEISTKLPATRDVLRQSKIRKRRKTLSRKEGSCCLI
jgi:hypothetical protein